MRGEEEAEKEKEKEILEEEEGEEGAGETLASVLLGKTLFRW